MHVLHGGSEVPGNPAQRSVFVPIVHDCAQRRLSVGCHSTSEMMEAVPGIWKPGGDALASCLQLRDESVIPQAFGAVCAHPPPHQARTCMFRQRSSILEESLCQEPHPTLEK